MKSRSSPAVSASRIQEEREAKPKPMVERLRADDARIAA
jgi:hypothetical protein